MNTVSKSFQKTDKYHLFTAFCITTFYWFQVLSFDKTVSVFYSLVLFAGSLVIYNLHGNITSDLLKKDKIRLTILLIASMGLIVGISGLNTFWIGSLLPAVVISGLYIFPVFSGGRRLRDLGYLKIFLLSGVITYLAVFLPLYMENLHPAVLTRIVFSRFLFVFLISLLFDIRDKESDLRNGWKSFPILLSDQTIRIMSVLILTVVGVTDFLMVYQFIITIPVFISLAISQFLLFILILKASTLKSKTYYGLLADILLAVPFLILILMS
jgi:4-hydroxybenzoate polyprenyltransferase